MKALRHLLILTCAIGFLSSCEEEKVPSSNYIDQLIANATLEIDDIVSPIFTSTDSIYQETVRANLESRLKNIEGVEDVDIYSNVITVKFLNQIERFWIQEIAYDFSDIDSLDILYNYEKVQNTNKTCLIINQLSSDHLMPWTYLRSVYPEDFVNKLSELLQSYGWQTTVVEENQVNLEFYKKSLSGYDLIFWMSHGMLTHSECKEEKVWLASNERVGDIYNLPPNLSDLEEKGEITIGTINGLRYWCISKGFIESNYRISDSPFRNTFFYLIACNGFTSSDFYQTLSIEGASGVAGWIGENKKAPRSGYFLIKNMLEGHSLGSAFETLNSRDKEDHCRTVPWVDIFVNSPCGEPCHDYAYMEIFPEDNSKYSIYLNQNEITTFTLFNPQFQWNLPYNKCYMPSISDTGSSNTLQMEYLDNEIDENSNLKVEILSVFDTGHRSYNEGYVGENWISINKITNTITLDMCTRFGIANYEERTVIVTNEGLKSNTLNYKIDRPQGAYKNGIGYPETSF